MPPGTPRSRSLTRFTMRVGFEHLGQSVDLVVSMTFLRSPVFAIFAMSWCFSFWDCLCSRTHRVRRLQRRGHILFYKHQLLVEGADSLPSVYNSSILPIFLVFSSNRAPCCGMTSKAEKRTRLEDEAVWMTRATVNLTVSYLDNKVGGLSA